MNWSVVIDRLPDRVYGVSANVSTIKHKHGTMTAQVKGCKVLGVEALWKNKDGWTILVVLVNNVDHQCEVANAFKLGDFDYAAQRSIAIHRIVC